MLSDALMREEEQFPVAADIIAETPRPKWWLLHVLNYFVMGVFVFSVGHHLLGGQRREEKSMLPTVLIWSCCMAYFFGFFGISFVDHDEDLQYYEGEQREVEIPRLPTLLPTLLEDDTAEEGLRFTTGKKRRSKAHSPPSHRRRERRDVETVLGNMLIDSCEVEIAFTEVNEEVIASIDRGARALRLAGGTTTQKQAATMFKTQLCLVAGDAGAASFLAEIWDREILQFAKRFGQLNSSEATALPSKTAGRHVFVGWTHPKKTTTDAAMLLGQGLAAQVNGLKKRSAYVGLVSQEDCSSELNSADVTIPGAVVERSLKLTVSEIVAGHSRLELASQVAGWSSQKRRSTVLAGLSLGDSDVAFHLEAVNSGKDLYASVAMQRHHHTAASVLLALELGTLATVAKPAPSKTAPCGLAYLSS